ncbi:hypothetical protein GCM10011506_34090 [Marivirga lumbricoides]|uniref:Uncharacterized protein n=1 Tax=Marivirga lumbricoides TaxID=1046115 RepID=A0ABQ1MSL3_9BACT|nr:hypothetical protein GCM10011506_34090 [Marivirga lumbricoides]
MKEPNKILEAVLDSLSIEDLEKMIKQKKQKQGVKPLTELESYRLLIRQKLKAKMFKN